MSASEVNGVGLNSPSNQLKEDYQQLKSNYAELKKLQEEVKKLETVCVSSSASQLKKVESIKKLSSDHVAEGLTTKEVVEIEGSLRVMHESLPRTTSNNLFLRSIVGSINVTLPNREDKLIYKERYENFKRNVTIVICILSLLAIWLKDTSRLPESLLQFVSAWFYLALTVREHILLKNGSKIATWWIVHHYISIVIAGVILIWPEGECYRSFQMQFLYFTLSLSVIMYLQFIYQKSQLYKLRTLGRATQMEFVQDSGIRTKSMGDLSFLVPFLFFTYMFQLSNSYQLYSMWYTTECQQYWQVPVSCLLFLVIALGNTWTLFAVLLRKYRL